MLSREKVPEGPSVFHEKNSSNSTHLVSRSAKSVEEEAKRIVLKPLFLVLRSL